MKCEFKTLEELKYNAISWILIPIVLFSYVFLSLLILYILPISSLLNILIYDWDIFSIVFLLIGIMKLLSLIFCKNSSFLIVPLDRSSRIEDFVNSLMEKRKE